MDRAQRRNFRLSPYDRPHNERQRLTRLNFLIIGKTGHGKSSTGNSILRRQAFRTSNNSTSETSQVRYEQATFDNYRIKVVDGPSLMRTDRVRSEDIRSTIETMNTSLHACFNRVDAFLFVFKFGSRFTAEDKEAFNTLVKIFGVGFLENLIVVITGGDLFYREVKGLTFKQWCRNQTGELGQLYRDCSNRFVLLDNTETEDLEREHQVKQIIRATGHEQYNPYRIASFENARPEHNKLMLDANREQIVKAITCLLKEIDQLRNLPSANDQQRILNDIRNLERQMRFLDEKFGVQSDLWALVAMMKDSLFGITDNGRRIY